jgi:hypothetical protein
MNKMYCQLQMDMDGDLGDKYPQEREGVQGGELPISSKPRPILCFPLNYPCHEPSI